MAKQIVTTNEKGEKVIRRFTRRFEGEFPPKSTFDKKMLKAYLKGQRRFSYKRDEQDNPVYYLVKQRMFVEEVPFK
jgi:hypothetical protein